MATEYYQVLVSADEMRGPAKLTEYHLLAGNTVEVTFYNVAWSVCHTDVSELGSDMIANRSGNTPVPFYFKEKWVQQATIGEYFGFTFDSPFDYDGTGNLLFELKYLRKEKAGTINCRVHTKTKAVCECANDSTSTTGSPGSSRPGMRIYYDDGSGITFNTIGIKEGKIKTYSNPNTGDMRFEFKLVEKSSVSVDVFDLKGKVVKALMQDAVLEKGNHTLEWNCRSGNNSTGMLFMHWTFNGKRKVKKLLTF